MPTYYDGTKLLSLLDINGDKPEIYLCTTNRSGGKTTYFNRLVVRRFLKGQGKFCLLYRYSYELDDVAGKFFKDIQTLFFPEYTMRAEKRSRGVYQELFLCKAADEEDKGISCGYAVSLNSADMIKKLSHFFSDVSCMLMDEFQSETNNYCSNEITKFKSIHNSIARGQGEQSRYVPVFMLSNPVTLLNPYYIGFGIAGRLQENTKFLRGVGWVMEQGFVESASNALKASAFNRAFVDDGYLQYATEGVYLNDNKAFVEKPEGIGKYLATLRFRGKDYGLRLYSEQGIVYCDDHPDQTFPDRYAITTSDFTVNFVMLKTNDFFFQTLRYYFNHGCFRFKGLQEKEAIITALGYRD